MYTLTLFPFLIRNALLYLLILCRPMKPHVHNRRIQTVCRCRLVPCARYGVLDIIQQETAIGAHLVFGALGFEKGEEAAHDGWAIVGTHDGLDFFEPEQKRPAP